MLGGVDREKKKVSMKYVKRSEEGRGITKTGSENRKSRERERELNKFGSPVTHVSRVNHPDLCAAAVVSLETSDGDKRSMPWRYTFVRGDWGEQDVRGWELIFVIATDLKAPLSFSFPISHFSTLFRGTVSYFLRSFKVVSALLQPVLRPGEMI